MDNFLIKVASKLRKRIVETSSFAKIPHLGSCFSCLDILVYLYWKELSINPKKPNEENRDRFILSKGHGAPALFQVLAEKNFFPLERLDEFGKNGSLFHEHPPKPGYIPGIEAATGSLGHGLSMGVGIALASKLSNKNYKTYVLISDGECNEGTIWEAALLAPTLNLDKLTVIIDFNKWQATGRSEEIMQLQPLYDKWKSFGWQVIEIDGHDFNEIQKGFSETHKCNNKPSLIIANTIKGKGVSFMEDNNNWHYRIPNNEELKKAIIELESKK
tara:strand:- start:312 stop:1130 length:819 start_codon:yes stop_codon:yes gene_type:complete